VLAVKHLCGPKLFLAAAFVLAVALKLIVHQQQAVSAYPEDTSGAVNSFLLHHGFDSRLEKRFGVVVIDANAGKCRMLIREAAPQGWDNSSIELMAKVVGKLSYVFDGAVYVQQPFLAPMIEQYWTWARFKMGFGSSRHPMFAVAASDDCAIDELPWSELGVLS
jgi:hypothetical protein